MNKEELKKVIEDGVQESFPVWSDYMTVEEFENLEPLISLTVLTALMKLKNI